MKLKMLPAEWAPQSAVQLTWPDESTDWVDILDEVYPVYAQLANCLSQYSKVLIVCASKEAVLPFLEHSKMDNILFLQHPINDTWARDHGAITVLEEGCPVLYDFKFNGWGLKFAADKDNLLTSALYASGLVKEGVGYQNQLNFVLEGGAIESDGLGTIITTSECLLSPNRNGAFTKEQVELYLKDCFGVKRVLWINNGYLAGDDTDSHVDTLVRLINENTLMYVQCADEKDEHYPALRAMELELQQFKQTNGLPYILVPLPMADVVFDGADRLPATYANFLITNRQVLVPTYNSPKDTLVLDLFKREFKNHEIVGINCLPLIKQHGSLHCITMQYPQGVF